jgi:hypothetical protein
MTFPIYGKIKFSKPPTSNGTILTLMVMNGLITTG